MKAGLDTARTKIEVVGNPSYEGFIEYAASFTNKKKQEFKRTLGFDPDDSCYSLFLSPSSFSRQQIEEVEKVLEVLSEKRAGCAIVMKLHPSTKREFYEVFRGILNRFDKFYLTGDFTGDNFNLDIVLSSDAIIQKQSTVGYIAMLCGVPIISYNLFNTDYWDDLYKYLDCSLHAESVDKLQSAFDSLDSESEMSDLKNRQALACDNFCKRINSPSREIARILKHRLASG